MTTLVIFQHTLLWSNIQGCIHVFMLFFFWTFLMTEKPIRESFSQGTKSLPEMTVIIISILCIGFFSLAVSTFSMHDQHEPHIVSRLQFLIKYCNDVCVPELRHRTFYACAGPKPEQKKEGLEKDAFTLRVNTCSECAHCFTV